MLRQLVVLISLLLLGQSLYAGPQHAQLAYNRAQWQITLNLLSQSPLFDPVAGEFDLEHLLDSAKKFSEGETCLHLEEWWTQEKTQSLLVMALKPKISNSLSSFLTTSTKPFVNSRPKSS